MNFDYIAFGIIKEHLMPSFDGITAPIRVWYALGIQVGHESDDIICAVRDVAPLKRIYDLT